MKGLVYLNSGTHRLKVIIVIIIIIMACTI
jgi:hypothetical protein